MSLDQPAILSTNPMSMKILKRLPIEDKHNFYLLVYWYNMSTLVDCTQENQQTVIGVCQK